MEKREFDIIVWGATGFTGRLVAEYLCEHAPEVVVALGGRNVSKLEEVREFIAGSAPGAAGIPIVIADSHDPQGLEEMTARTKVLITTVGPYVLHGEALVGACIASGTHYLDITGEPAFVQQILKKYDTAAREKGVLVLNCCGFDSIPADLGAFYTAALLPDHAPKTIKGYVSFSARFSGGTWASALEAFSGGSKALSSGGGGKKGRTVPQKVEYNKDLGKWVLPMPVIDPWMVKRSAQYRPDIYGNDFAYGQFLTQKRLSDLIGLVVALGGAVLGSQVPFIKGLLKKIQPTGEGPDASTRAKSYFKVEFVGEGGGKTVRTIFSGGDPGYTETSKMLSESALIVLRKYDKLKIRSGVTTPAAALGDFLVKALIEKGIHIETI